MMVMYSLYKMWCDMILSGSKPLEFRTRLPKMMKPGSKILLYETKKHGGAGAVVGECTVERIIPVLSNDGKWPMSGCYPFLEYYCENILHDASLTEHVRSCIAEFSGKPANYRHGYILRFLFSPENLESIRQNNHPVELMKLSIPERDKIL